MYRLLSFDSSKILLAPVAILVHGVLIESCSRRNRGSVVFTGEKAAGKRVIGDEGDTKLPGHGDKLLLNSSCQQVIHLLSDECGLIVLLLCDTQHLSDLPAGVIRGRRIS